MVQEVRKVSKKGVPYMERIIANVSSLIPAEFKGKFLLFDPPSGCLVTRTVVKKTDAEKKARKEEKARQLKEKYSSRVKDNAQIKEKLKKMQSTVNSLAKEIRKNAVSGDVSELQDERNVLLSQIDELRSLRKLVPKQFM